MNCILFDDQDIKEALLPLTYLRPVAKIRVGVWTISEKWKLYFDNISYLTEEYLEESFPLIIREQNILINGALCPDPTIVARINSLELGTCLYHNGRLVAACLSSEDTGKFKEKSLQNENRIEIDFEPTFIDRTWKIFQNNGEQLRRDISILTKEKSFNSVTDKHTVVYNPSEVYIGDNVSVKAAVIDAENGPVFIGNNCTISPGSIIRGPFAMLENSHLSMGARMRGDITIGPHCKVGGEVANSVIFGYSNKAHDGYLGNSIVGEWCNIGADTNTSNMKNDYTDIKVWNYKTDSFESSGSPFCGLVMGDHSKCGINVMFNSGTTVGVSSNIYNANYPRNFIPSFVKGGAGGWSTMPLKKGIELAKRVTMRRNIEFDSVDEVRFEKVFELSSKYRLKSR